MTKIGMPTLMEFSSVKENLEVAKELGLDFLELNINMLYCTPDEDFRNQLIQYQDEYNIEFTMHYYDTVDVSSSSRHYRNYLYTAFSEIGKYLEGICKKMVLHLEPGAYMTIHSEKHYVYASDITYIDRTLNTLKTIREVLEPFGIKVVIENVPIHPFMEGLYQTLGLHNFEFCYDIGHDIIYNDRLYNSFRKKYKLNVTHMHMHNVKGSKDHQALDTGDLDIDRYIEYALDNDIDIVVEVKDLDNLKKSISYIKNKIQKRM